jgi:hypothetical protein
VDRNLRRREERTGTIGAENPVSGELIFERVGDSSFPMGLSVDVTG